MKLLFFFLLLSNVVFAQENKEFYSSLIIENTSDVIKLEKDLSYYYMTASNSYLAWYEGYTNKVYYKNLLTEEVTNLKFKSGRGPYEILSLRGLAIANNHLFILDSQGNKILKFNFEKGIFESEMSTGGTRIIFITSSNNQLYGKGVNRNGIYFEIGFDKEVIVPLKNSLEQKEILDLTNNMFRFEGPFLANNEYLISVRNYEPSMFISELEGEIKEFDYDRANFEPEYEFNEFGIATRPPSKLSMRIYDAALKPNSNIVYLAREGYTVEYPENNRSVLYKYDYVKREYVGVLETENESIGKIATNDKYIFIYDDKNFTITKIKL